MTPWPEVRRQVSQTLVPGSLAGMLGGIAFEIGRAHV